MPTDVTADSGRVLVVASRFNEGVTRKLLEGARGVLAEEGFEQQDVVWVPGAFELPLVCQRLAQGKKVDAVIALGVVIRGATAHFELVAGEAAKGVGNAASSSGVPVIFGVLTTDTIEQAVERAGTKAGNKGSEAALTALEMVNLLAQLTAENL